MTANQKTEAPNNGTPWYKTCTAQALGAGALHVGIDAIGLIPEAGGISRMIGHQAGYVGVVADQVGYRVVNAFGKSTGTVSGLAGLGGESVAEGVWDTSLTIAGFIPALNDVAAVLSIGTASAFNSLYQQNFGGAAAGAAGEGLGITYGIAYSAGASWAKAIPIVGYVVNTAATIHDLGTTISAGYNAYNTCMSQP